MRVLADTSLFVKFCRQLPLPEQVEVILADSNTDRCLSPVSVIELFRLWQNGAVPDDPDIWLDLALPSWTVLPVTVPIRAHISCETATKTVVIASAHSKL